ncbi:15066_t:CDS:10, partial [Entrophospora sp. SA101]
QIEIKKAGKEQHVLDEENSFAKKRKQSTIEDPQNNILTNVNENKASSNYIIFFKWVENNELCDRELVIHDINIREALMKWKAKNKIQRNDLLKETLSERSYREMFLTPVITSLFQQQFNEMDIYFGEKNLISTADNQDKDKNDDETRSSGRKIDILWVIKSLKTEFAICEVSGLESPSENDNNNASSFLTEISHSKEKQQTKSSELEISPPVRLPTTPEQSPTRRKKSREDKDSIFSLFFGSASRPSSPSYEPILQTMNHFTSKSNKSRNSTFIRKHSAENLKSALSLPQTDGPRRKSFDSVQNDINANYVGYFPPPEIAHFTHQQSIHQSSPSSADFSKNSGIHRRTRSSESDSVLDSGSLHSTASSNTLINPTPTKEKKTIFPKWFIRKGSKDKEIPAPPEASSRKNSDAEPYIHTNLVITPTYDRDDPFGSIITPTYPKSATLPGKNDIPWIKSKKDKSGKKKDLILNGINLDTDFVDMNDIIRNPNYMLYDELQPEKSFYDGSEIWSPPESWAFTIRIFRPDSTFGTVNCSLNTTTAELCQMLGKKFFVQDISKYNLFVKRHYLERVLTSHERPLKLQKIWLERAGYTEKDNLEDLGREDNSYLVRFTFRETTVPRFEEEVNISNFQHVDLQARNLQTIPIFLYKHAHVIRSLNVSQNLMLDLPTDFIQSCTQLRELHLSSNDLERIPQSVRQSELLSSLNINSNKLKDLDHAKLDKIKGILNLQVENNMLQSLPEYFERFTTLNFLNIANNSFTEFPLVICKITTLSKLDVSFNKISSIPDEIGQLVHLKRLFMIGNQLADSLPNSFKNLTSLRELDIRKNKIQNLDVISSMPNIERLLADSNKISMINLSSRTLQQLILSSNRFTQFGLSAPATCLTVLSLAHSKLTTLPDELFENLPAIEKIDLSNNQFVSLPKTIGLLTRLTHLSCVNNILSELPGEISTLVSLRVLEIRNNNLTSLPQEIWLCNNLTVLNANNNLTVEIFPAISLLMELKILNLSFNDLDEIPTGGLINPYLTELYLSGNQLSSLPDDIEKLSNLRILHVNGNKLQTLPAELSKIRKLIVLDVGSNALKYNIANWQYDWNWNWNMELKFLNLSGNKRFEIKHAHVTEINPLRDRNLAGFGALTRLSVLGLMDITLLNLTVPDENDNRRIRTSSSEVNSMSYGMADILGIKDHHLSIWETVIPKFRSRDDECLFGLFDGRNGPDQGGPVTKYLHDWFPYHFKSELEKLKDNETVESAIRRTFLGLNKELGLKVFNSSFEKEYARENESNHHHSISLQIGNNKSGASGLIAYISGTKLYVANVGDTTAVISRNDGNAHVIAKCEDPTSTNEFQRIREAGGFLSHDFLVNGEFSVSKSFGHFHLMPIINSNPVIDVIELSEQDEFVILATKGLWDCMSYQTAVDIARTEKKDLMMAAQKLRDFAIAYGSEKKLMVMIIGVGDLFCRRSKPSTNTGDPNFKKAQYITEEPGTTFFFGTSKKRIRKEEVPSDSMMARLQKEISPPTGQVALVFTDIKNSTFLWETIPVAMRHAIKQHNTIMRRQLRNIGGYEVKTEGDAFMVSFPTVSSALLWCFTVQLQLLEVDWPQEIIDSDDGKEIYGGEYNELLHRGLSVRMGIHLGVPVCETDIVTKRMDYFGPMVNRTARICNAADGGQICVSSDVEAEIRLLDGLMDANDHDSLFKKNGEYDDYSGPLTTVTTNTIVNNPVILDKNLIALRKMGFVVKNIGEKKLKGLENTEVLSLVFPEALKGRMEEGQQNRITQENIFPPSCVRQLGYLCLRLERITSGNINNQYNSARNSRADYLTGLLTFHVKDNADDEELLRIMESLITRIENVISALYLKNVSKHTRIREEFGETTQIDPEYIIDALRMYIKMVGINKTKSNKCDGSPA